MDFDEYQKAIQITDLGTGPEHGISPSWLYYSLGIAGETGELMEKIKKHFRDDYGKMTPERLEEIKKELGDILWYQTRLADYFGITMTEVAQANLDKLYDRLERNKLHGEGDNR